MALLLIAPVLPQMRAALNDHLLRCALVSVNQHLRLRLLLASAYLHILLRHLAALLTHSSHAADLGILLRLLQLPARRGALEALPLQGAMRAFRRRVVRVVPLLGGLLALLGCWPGPQIS